MAKTAERSGREQPSPRDVGRHLRQVRKQQGLSRTVVARSAGLTRRELAAYERGRTEVPESDLWCLAGSCGVDVSDLLPRRESLHISTDLSSIGVGDTVRRLRGPTAEPEGLLREYLSMICELRDLPPGSHIPFRQPDLAALADALGGSPEAIENRLIQLVGVSHDEAARLRSMILPPLSLPSPVRDSPLDDPYALLAQEDVSPAIEQFFAAPGPADPFAALNPSPMPASTGCTAEPAAWDPPAPEPPTLDPRPSTAGPPLAVRPPAPPPPAPDPVTAAGTTPPSNPFEVLEQQARAAASPDQFVTSEPVVAPGMTPPSAPSNPFEGPVDPHAGAAAQRDPFDPPSADDPLAPLPLPPDPFAPPLEVWADPIPPEPGAANGNGAGVVVDDPFARSGLPTDGGASNGSVGLSALDAIVVDDPMRPDSPDRKPPSTLDVDTDRDDARPIIRPSDPIAWKATVDAPVAATGVVAPAPRFERANAQWQVGGIFPATAMADDGTLALRRADTRWALTNLSAPGDCIIEATFDLRAGSGFGVVFRASVADERITGYSFDVDPVAGGGGYLVRLWEDSRQHWRPLAHAPLTDPGLLFGHHAVRITLRGDQLSVLVDGDPVLDVPALSRATLELGREPCRGDRVGVQAWSTTEVTVESFRVANL